MRELLTALALFLGSFDVASAAVSATYLRGDRFHSEGYKKRYGHPPDRIDQAFYKTMERIRWAPIMHTFYQPRGSIWEQSANVTEGYLLGDHVCYWWNAFRKYHESAGDWLNAFMGSRRRMTSANPRQQRRGAGKSAKTKGNTRSP